MASKPVKPAHADHDDEGYPITDGGQCVATFSERLQWQTTVDDLPDLVVHEAGTLFCDCGADGAYTRIWETADVDRDRLKSLLVILLESLKSKGFDVDARSFASAACEAFDLLPHVGGLGPFQEGQDSFWDDRPACANDVFAAAVEAGVAPKTEAIATRSTA